MLIEDITINHFMNAWFKEDYSQLSKEDFEKAYCEYVDVSGIYESKQFDLLSYIYRLSNRVDCIKLSLSVQREFLEVFGEPYVLGLVFFEKFQHKVYWNGDKKQFLEYLMKIESKEKKYITELNRKQKEFKDIQSKNANEVKTLMQSRQEFIRMLNMFGKEGYKIDREKTFVEELALIIKERRDLYATKPS